MLSDAGNTPNTAAALKIRDNQDTDTTSEVVDSGNYCVMGMEGNFRG